MGAMWAELLCVKPVTTVIVSYYMAYCEKCKMPAPEPRATGRVHANGCREGAEAQAHAMPSGH